MQNPVIWEIPVPEVTVDELLVTQGSGGHERTLRPAVLKLNQRLLAEAAELAHPTIIWREASISRAEELELFLKDGSAFRSRLLVKLAGTADKLILYAMTIGASLETRVDEYKKAQKIMEAFTLDSAGSALLSKSAASAVAKIEEEYKKSGMSLTFPLGPGHSYWNGLEDVRKIINFLDADKIGISLTDSNFMLPRKSLAFVMGAGKNLPDYQNKIHCDFCNLQSTCNLRGFGGKC